MTVAKAIELLTKLQDKHGADVPVYFDCPHCNQAFTPGVLETKAVVLKSQPTESRS